MANKTPAARRNAQARGSGRPAKNVLAALSAAHWAMQPDLLRTMITVASRTNPPIEAIESERGTPLDRTWSVTVRDGIATLPVHGAMFRYADYFSYMSGGATYESIAEDFIASLKDPDVRAILLDIDSGGGEVHGCQGLAKLIAAGRSVKPIAAFGAGDMCSAAYWLGSAAGRIVAAPTAVLGCLGVYTCITDFSKWEAEQGIETIELRSSQTPNKNRDPATAEGRDDVQQVLDALCEVFLGDVALYRDVSIETVLNDFGQGGVFVGAAAAAAGLADEIGSYDDVHAELRDRADGTSATVIFGAGRAPSSTTLNAEQGMNKPKAAGNAPANAGANQPDPAADTTVDPNAPAEDEEKKKTTDGEEPEVSADDATTAERTRVLGIQALQRTASDAPILAACVNDGSTIEAAALKLVQADRKGTADAGKKRIDALRGDEAHAPAPKGANASADETPSVDVIADSILQAGRHAGTVSTQRAKR